MQLLSETSGITWDHGELVKVIQDAPILECQDLRDSTLQAISRYSRDRGPQVALMRRINEVGRNMISAVNRTHEALHADPDDIDFHPPEVNDLFKPLTLVPFRGDDRQFDQALKTILGNIEGVAQFEQPGVQTYLCRIAVERLLPDDPEVELIAEISRRRQDGRPRLPDVHRAAVIGYSLKFSGFEHDLLVEQAKPDSL